MKKVIVIGAGVAGLATAVRLQSKGYKVELFEKNGIPGGKMNQIKQDGYTFDVGPTLVMMPKIYEDVYRDAGRDPEDYIKMKRLEPMYSVYFNRPEYPRYDVSSDLVKLGEMMKEKGPETMLGFQQYLAEIYKRYLVAEKHFITRPFRSWKDIYNPFMIRQAMKLKTFDSANNMMAKYIPDKDIQQMLAFQTLYIGVSPQNGPSLYNIIPMIEIMYGVWFLKGGMHSMAQGMAKLLEELGGTIRYSSEVEEIFIEGGKAKGVKVDGEIFESDYVVSNADFPYTMKNLVKDEKSKGKYTDRKLDSMDYSCSCLIFYWGMDKKYEGVETHTFVVSEDLDKNLTQIFSGEYIEDASIYLSIPSRGDEEMAPEGKDAFYVLMPTSELSTAKYEYNDEIIAKYREKALQKIEKLPGCENVRNEIVTETMMTPKDFESKFNAYNGATFGLQPTLRQSNHWRPQAKCKSCENLYFAGSSVHPGAGVPIVLESGKICAEELRRDNPEDDFN
ncbi:dehydrosqualene desaturase [Andreesenia angusta]|uniref:Dehydrosqualene desaturase n=1 Tax=Andreesenia angusta TaxID=39480 RepID=A0A1S1V5Z0_9FIRM|nr:phytoene desaturase family protein [Andreesenia angusta]OHW62008.1 dehydrosqualene desaturase [Andreesenia angusta]